MPDLTPNLGIKKPLGNENVTKQHFLDNWDIIDAAASSLGKDNMSVNLVKALTLEVDTRKKKYTTDANGQLQKIEYLNGAIVVKTVNFTVDANGQLTGKTEVAAGKTVTTTITVKANGDLDEITKVVV